MIKLKELLRSGTIPHLKIYLKDGLNLT